MRLDPKLALHPMALSLMRESEVLVFDGDPIHPESFTKFLMCLLASYCEDTTSPGNHQAEPSPAPPPKLLAYRLDYSGAVAEIEDGKDNRPASFWSAVAEVHCSIIICRNN
jgi:hypothetical protein